MANYYVDPDWGSDSNTGTSTNAPWKTITKVNTIDHENNTIFFKSGTTTPCDATLDLSDDTGVTVTSYGEGPWACLDYSNNAVNAITATGTDGLVVKRLTFRGAEFGTTNKYGIFLGTSSETPAAGPNVSYCDFFGGVSAYNEQLNDGADYPNVAISNCRVYDTLNDGFDFSNGSTATVTDCEVYRAGRGSGAVAAGDAVSGHNAAVVNVYRLKAIDCGRGFGFHIGTSVVSYFDSFAITPYVTLGGAVGDSTATANFYNCVGIIDGAANGFTSFDGAATVGTTYCFNCTVINRGSGISFVSWTGGDTKTTNCISLLTGSGVHTLTANGWSADSNYNCYWPDGDLWDTAASTFADWKTATSSDANSQVADPHLLHSAGDREATSARLAADSAAIGAGTVPGTANDFAGVHRGTPYSQGAYEFLNEYASRETATLDALRTGSVESWPSVLGRSNENFRGTGYLTGRSRSRRGRDQRSPNEYR